LFVWIGLPKGTFYFRGRVKKPGYQPELGGKPEFYEPKDFFVGNIMNINSFDFQLLRGDEFTYAYMERNKELVSSKQEASQTNSHVSFQYFKMWIYTVSGCGHLHLSE